MAVKILIAILVIFVILLVVLYFVGKKLQKKQAEQQAQIEAAKQTVTMLIIDKKKLKLKEAGLPAAVLEQTPKYMRRAKFPIVKAKTIPISKDIAGDKKADIANKTKNNIRETRVKFIVIIIYNKECLRPAYLPDEDRKTNSVINRQTANISYCQYFSFLFFLFFICYTRLFTLHGKISFGIAAITIKPLSSRHK